MALPSSYTTVTLTQFMRDTLAETGKALNWADARFTEPINATLLAYGVSTVEAATSVQKLRLLAAIEAWRAVMNATAGDYDASSQGDELKRSQVHANAKAMFKLAQEAYTDWLAQGTSTEPGSIGREFVSANASAEVGW